MLPVSARREAAERGRSETRVRLGRRQAQEKRQPKKHVNTILRHLLSPLSSQGSTLSRPPFRSHTVFRFVAGTFLLLPSRYPFQHLLKTENYHGPHSSL